MGESKSGRCAYNQIVAEPLRKENHEEWFELVGNYLVVQDLCDMVDGSSARPPEDEDHKEDFIRWRRKNAAALHIIQISCSSESLSHIRGVSEAKDAWHILNHTYNPPEPEPKPKSVPEPEPEPEPEPKLGPTSESQEMKEKVQYDVAILYNAICNDNWSAAKAFLEEHPETFIETLDSHGHTSLHVAAQLGHARMVEEFVILAPTECLERVNVSGFTPLAMLATYTEFTHLAARMVIKNSNIIGIPNSRNSLPVSMAFSNSRKKMGRYLYSITPLKYFKSENAHLGVDLLYWCFISGTLDVALDLLQKCKELLFAIDIVKGGWGPIMGIAAMPPAFSNKSQLVFWKRWIYDYINIQSSTTSFVCVDIQQEDEGRRVQGLGLLHMLISYACKLLGTEGIYELKLLHAQSTQILSLVCENVTFLDKNRQKEDIVANALYDAAKKGNVEFVVKVSNASPQSILLVSTSLFWNTFFYAVQNRQAEVFNLIHGIRFKDGLASFISYSGNTMLHVAGQLAPSFQLNRISGPALKMQRELQWFKEVESIVPHGFKALQNLNGMNPQDIFKESHKDLRKEGEKWMKETASSCSVVGALVVTIMFAAAFTIPGGNNQDSGYPLLLNEKLFLLFIISDALSLFSSSTSVLMFLGILSSRYADEDVLKSLPSKLIIGLSTLFWSIATMMIAFVACILIMLQHSYSWSPLPVIMFASVPVTLFVLLQFPLLVQMVSSTYGPGIFNRNVKMWL